MFKNFKNFCNKPITYGDTFKMSGICALIYMVIAFSWVLYDRHQTKKFKESSQKKENED